jgi:hypothetical protein
MSMVSMSEYGIAYTILHKASVSARGVGAMVVGLTHNNQHRRRRCIQMYLVQDCDLRPFHERATHVDHPTVRYNL